MFLILSSLCFQLATSRHHNQWTSLQQSPWEGKQRAAASPLLPVTLLQPRYRYPLWHFRSSLQSLTNYLQCGFKPIIVKIDEENQTHVLLHFFVNTTYHFAFFHKAISLGFPHSDTQKLKCSIFRKGWYKSGQPLSCAEAKTSFNPKKGIMLYYLMQQKYDW